MNSFGRIFRVHIFGESHGPSVGVVIDGCPAGIFLSADDFREALSRRAGGTRKGTTPRNEPDEPVFLSGLLDGKTTGAPLTIIFYNKDTRSRDYEALRDIPRPGHADFVADKKFGGFNDFRGSGHFSGRLTVCLVAAGVIAGKVLSAVSQFDIAVSARITEVGGETDVEAGIQKAIEANDSVGGIIECKVEGLPIGLGEPFFDSVESLISHAVFSVPAIRGIEFGTGFSATKMFGSQHNDSILNKEGKTVTNHAGGIVGGLTNGNPLIFQVAVKPPSSTPKEQQSLNVQTNTIESFSVEGRHDLCVALRAEVVIEAVTQLVLADLLLIAGYVSPVVGKK